MSQPPDESPEELVQRLREATLAYEALDEEIDKLLTQYGGKRENMTQDVYDRYQALAVQRAEAYNTMKALERQLFGDL